MPPRRPGQPAESGRHLRPPERSNLAPGEKTHYASKKSDTVYIQFSGNRGAIRSAAPRGRGPSREDTPGGPGGGRENTTPNLARGGENPPAAPAASPKAAMRR